MPRFRPQLRFSLRTLLVLVTLLCAPLGWLGYQFNWIRQRREALATGWMVDISDSTSLPAPGVLGLFGEQGYASLLLIRGRPVGAEWLPEDDIAWKRAEALFPEASISGVTGPPPQADANTPSQP